MPKIERLQTRRIDAGEVNIGELIERQNKEREILEDFLQIFLCSLILNHSSGIYVSSKLE